MFVGYVLLGFIILIIYLMIGYNIYHNAKKNEYFQSSITIPFFIIYMIFFIIIINLVLITIFYNKMLKKKGLPGPVGVRGDQGIRGNNGICQLFCLSNDCAKNIRKEILKTFLALAKQDYENNNMNQTEIKYYESIQKMTVFKEIRDPDTGTLIKTKMKNDLLEKMITTICKSKEYNISVSAFKPSQNNVINYIIDNHNTLFPTKPSYIIFSKESKDKSTYKNSSNHKIYDENTIRNILNDSYSRTIKKDEKEFIKQVMEIGKKYLNDSRNSSEKKFTPDNIQKYIKNIFNEWIKIIYDSLDRPYIDFFNNKYASNSNVNWKHNKNPFDEIMKYDLYQWGLTRLFYPAHIKVDDNITFNNYLPEGGKPPLKYIKTNDLSWVYNNKLNRTGEKIKNEAFTNINNNCLCVCQTVNITICKNKKFPSNSWSKSIICRRIINTSIIKNFIIK